MYRYVVYPHCMGIVKVSWEAGINAYLSIAQVFLECHEPARQPRLALGTQVERPSWCLDL